MASAPDETDLCGRLRRADAGPEVAEVAGRQHGVISVEQLGSAGLTERAVRSWCRMGRLHRLYRGVYAVGWRPVRREGRFMAAVLAGGAGAVLSHDSAALLWGILPAPGGEIKEIHVTTPRRCIRSRGDLRSHETRRLDADEVACHHGIPLTTAARTVIDLAPATPFKLLRRATNQALVNKQTTAAQLVALVDRRSPVPGTATMKRLFAETIAETKSVLEDLTLDLLARYGIPRPKVNTRIWREGERIEPDLRWPSHNLVVELDGGEFHDNPVQRAKDAHTTALLRRAGDTVIRLTWNDVVHNEDRTRRRLQNALSSVDRR